MKTLAVMLTLCFALSGEAAKSEDAAFAAFRDELARAAAAGEFSGAALVAHNGKVVFASAYGMADRDHAIVNTIHTRFRIGSMNKMFTAIAVLQLAEQGKLKLTDTVGRFIPDYPNPEVAAKVTLQHLLTHTSGVVDFEYGKHRSELKSPADYVKRYGPSGLQFEPGAKPAYSSYGFILLGRIVEIVSGQDYYEYVREHIYKPAGMTSTDSLPENHPVADLAIGYTRDDDRGLRPNTDTLPWRGTPAGGGYSTVEDLLRFADALTGHKLLNAASTDLLTEGKVDLVPGLKMAYGFMDVRTRDGARWFGHNGGAPGMNAELRIFPETGYVVAVLANLDPRAAQRMSQFVTELLPLQR